MISAKKLLKMALKWKGLAGSKRERISFPRKLIADKGTLLCTLTKRMKKDQELCFNENDFID